MRVLYLCHRIPYPPDKGEKIRAFYQLQAIAARHEVDLFTLADGSELAHAGVLRGFCRSVVVDRLKPSMARLRALPYLLTQKPLTVPYFEYPVLRREIRAAVASRSYDRIFVYCSAMAQYVDPEWRIPVLADFVDVDSDKWRQYAVFARWPFSAIYRREARTLREYERQIGERSACVLVTTAREAVLIRQISDRVSVHVVPNGVDIERFQPPSQAAVPGPPTIGFTGDMSYFPNVEAVTFFARNVLPIVRRSVPAARFLVVGRNPSPKVLALSAIRGVEVTGFVPDVRGQLARMHVAVAPFSVAAGIQNKILEAMAFAIPVVCTPRAAQGLSDGAAGAVETVEGADAMAGRIVALLENPELARFKGLEGRSRVALDYRWDRSLGRLLDLLEHPTSPKPPLEAYAK